MSTHLATTAGALALRADQTAWTDEQLAVLRHMSTEKAAAADLRVFLHRCQQLELDPFAGQIHLVDYGGKPVIQVGIHGLESIARTVADRGGFDIEWEDDQWCGPDGVWRDVWVLEEPPTAARSVLIRDGKRYSSVSLYRENVGMRKVYEGPKGNRQWTGAWEVNEMWTKRPAHMTAKCSRAGALRKAFPRQLADVRAPEELGERPDTVHGEIVREDPAPAAAAPLENWLGLVAAATTRAEVEAVWHQGAPGLDIRGRAELQSACSAAVTRIEQQTDAEQVRREQIVVAVQQLLEECGWVDYDDQRRLVARITDTDMTDWETLPIVDLETAETVLRHAVESGDPQAFLDTEVADHG